MDAGICPDPGKIPLSNADGGALLALNGQFHMHSRSNNSEQHDTDKCSEAAVDRKETSRQELESYVPLSATLVTNSHFLSYSLSASPGKSGVSDVDDSLGSPFLTSSSPVTPFQSHTTPTYPSSRPSPSDVPLTLLSIRISPSAFVRPTAEPSIVPQSSVKSLLSSVPLLRSTSTCFPTVPFGSPCHVQDARPSTPSASKSVASSLASQRTITPAIPAKVNNFGVHAPSWYFGVIFGTIAGIALLVFLVSIILWVWKRTVRRRRARDTVVPWATGSGDEEQGGFMRSRGVSSQSAAMNLGSLEDLAYVRAWSPSGDRDVGEPRRAARSPQSSKYSLHDHPIPSHGLFSEDTMTGSRPTSSQPLYPRNTFRQLPSHLIDDNLAARAIQEEGPAHSRVPTRLRRRSRSRLEDAPVVNPYVDLLSSPQQQAQGPHQSMAERLRNLEKREGSWDRLPTPGRDQPREDFEPWAASFRANLVNALSALAAGLGATRSAANHELEDNLTAAPIRHRMSNRESPSKPSSQRTSSSTSLGYKGWVLHEKGDGSGIVQFLPNLEKYSTVDTTQRKSGRLSPILSFSNHDGEKISLSDDKTEHIQRTTIHRSLVPLVASSAPEKAIIRPESPFKSLGSAVPSKRSLLSRDSSYSVYSTSSSLKSRNSNQRFGVSRLQPIPSIAEHGV